MIESNAIANLYKQWCKDTKRNGGILIGPSIHEWTDFLVKHLQSLQEQQLSECWDEAVTTTRLNAAVYQLDHFRTSVSFDHEDIEKAKSAFINNHPNTKP